MNACIIYGAGTYGQVYAEYLKCDYHVLGFIDDNLPKGSLINSFEVLGTKEDLFGFEKSIAVFVPIGNNAIRVNLLKEIELKGFQTPGFIHSSCVIHETVEIGKSVYILASCNIMPLTKIGDYSMVSMGVNIAHHVEIQKGCFFSQGTNIGASIRIGAYSFFGIASTIMTGVNQIGKNSLIGAGSVVIKDVPDKAIITGVPGKVLRYIEI